MSLNPAGMGSANWNYSNPNKAGYNLELLGTVVAIQEIQAREYNPGSNQPGRPRFWPDGRPVWNQRIALACPDGSLKTFQYGEAGKDAREGKKPSVHMALYNLSGGNMKNLIGKTLHFVTWPEHPGEHPLLGYYIDNQGQQRGYPWNTDALKGSPWGRGNPRIFGIELVEGQYYELSQPLPAVYTVPELLADDGATGGAPAPQQQPQAMVGQFYAGPTFQPQYQQPAQYQPQQMQPQYQQVPIQQVPQSAPMPQGMDPAVAAAMQMAGAVNVQPVAGGGVYDEDIPF